ncbi:MAG TPA: dTMP kinase [Acholeplasmataceae bacterium]|nr:dTMP kinase [Acholeplasmataceae bacterium]
MKRFISFEGGEGSGKTTVIERLSNELNQLGYNIVKTREPGGSKIAEQIRDVILAIDNTNMDFLTEAYLYAASRRQHLVDIIIPALNEEKIVLCDRFIDSSLAYQGYARELGIEKVYKINEFVTNGFLPDLTIYIDVDPSIGLKRIKSNNRKVDRLDMEAITFHQKVRQGYLEVAKLYSNRIRIVDGNRDIEEIYNEIKNIVMAIL